LIKVGDKVAPFNRMTMTGTVVELVPVPVKQWMIGGTVSPTVKARILLDENKQVVEYLVMDLMRVE
tara:strand:+ start:591 stop:788 length:198 start_codon:yes stop_codon:yes gene_type:complete